MSPDRPTPWAACPRQYVLCIDKDRARVRDAGPWPDLDSGQGALRALRERNRAQVINVLRRAGPPAARTSRGSPGCRARPSPRWSPSCRRPGWSPRPTPRAAAAAAAGRASSSRSSPPPARPSAIDFGHTHLRVASADLSSRVLAERHRALDVDRAAGPALAAAVELVDE